jgi:hypothetical protein
MIDKRRSGMNTAQRVSIKIIKNKIKRTLTLLTVLRLSPIAYKKEIRELEEKLERYRQKYKELKVKELRGDD